jgi:dTDP-4-dehydrorhamnose 3,5-epimerase
MLCLEIIVMELIISPTVLEEVLIIDTRIFRDERGFFLEGYNRRDFESQGLHLDFVQDNHSRSKQNVVRGIHFQDTTHPQVKLVRCTVGKILDVVVDLRIDSTTFGKWISVELSAENARQVLVPIGFGHGFSTLSDFAEVQYKCTDYYSPHAEGAVLWNDIDLNIDWQAENPIVSQKDQAAQSLKAYRLNPAFR